MPNYIQDPNDSNKQVPGPKTDQHFDRMRQPVTGSFVQQPHYVLITGVTVSIYSFNEFILDTLLM